ncbi:Dyp-type peroxidase [Nocardioides albertanoniae]|uniref:Dyp-type peroxidase n=1 Tax=Nocardioides albertanoniae TaxID=1175486 RepID=UPI0011539C57|nr:Dyp-type peroxidase [Nocardioides albertanoniae]
MLAPPAKAAIFLTVTIRDGKEQEARDALADVAGVTRAIGFRIPEAALTCVVGIGAHAWDRMYAAARPDGLHPFRPLAGDKHVAVSTPGDLLFHVRADRPDLCFELGRQLMVLFAGLVDTVDEVHGFRYWDQRDLLGFVDGTESPTDAAESGPAALVGFEGSGDLTYAGASYVIVQKYLHDLDTWDRLSVEEQELVIGRKKLSDIELPDSVKPDDSHVELNTITDPDGTERDIVRDNMPFGAVGTGEFGTYFIGYAADPGVTEEMLRNMFLGRDPGKHDRILDFSTAVTGCLFFVPPADFLEDPEPFLAQPGSTAADGSLGIGRLAHSAGRSDHA